MKIILCIDDMPGRYLKLAKRLKETCNIFTAVTCRKEDVDFYLEGIVDVVGIILDHDMPNFSGDVFVRHYFQERNLPILISSHNPVGAERIIQLLDEYETPNHYAPGKRFGRVVDGSD